MTAVVYHLATWREDKRTWRTPQEWCDPGAAERAITNLAAALNLNPDAASNACVETVLATWAHHTLTAEEKALLFEDFAHAVYLLGLLDSGERTWEDVLPDLTCADRTQVAREHVDMAASEALNVLLNGRNGGAA